jgi:hypothetical protein
MNNKKQTCIVPIYGHEKDKNTGKKIKVQIGHKIKLPKTITSDLGFEMMFGWKTNSQYYCNSEAQLSGIKVRGVGIDSPYYNG